MESTPSTRTGAGEQNSPPAQADPWRDNELARRRRLEQTGRRSLSENLKEGLALSEFLATFTGRAGG